MKSLDKKTIVEFLRLASERLKGEWLWMGGTLLSIVGAKARPTQDIDIVPCNSKSNSQTIALLEIAQALKLPVESINSAGSLFLSKIPERAEHFEVILKNEKVTIYRPDAYLFIRLKMSRLSDSDLSDICAYLELFPLKQTDKVQLKIHIQKIPLIEKNDSYIKRLQKLNAMLS